MAANSNILVYGHRGARGLAPENAIPAYKLALQLGVDAVDMDVNMTKDGVVVVTHDFALNPDITRDQQGHWIENKILIKDLTFKALKTYDVGRIKPGSDYAKRFPDQQPVDGTTIPSLKEVIQYVEHHQKKHVRYQIEIKSDPAHPEKSFSPEVLAKAVVDVLKETKIDDRVELQAFNWRVLQTVQKLDSNIATAYLTSTSLVEQMHSDDPALAGLDTAGYLLKNYDNSVPKMIAALGGNIWGPDSEYLNPLNVDEAHAHHLRVVPWTVDTLSEMNRMIAIGVDGIITDRPDLLLRLLRR